MILLTFLASMAMAEVVDRLEASVNSAIILRSDVERFRKTVSLRAQIDPLFGGTVVGQKGGQASDSEIVEFLIDDRLIALAYPVSDAETDAAINQIQTENRLTRSALRDALAEQGFAFEDYYELIRLSVSKKNLVEADIRTKVSVTDDDVKNFYFNRYNRDSKAPLTYAFQMLSLNPADFKNAAAAREVLERAVREIRAGEAFDEVAKRVTGGTEEGAISRLGEDQVSPMVRAELKKLKIGEVSGVLGSPQSLFFVLKLVDATAGDSERFLKMKEEIRNQLAASEYQHQIGLWLERQRQNAFIHKAGEPTVAAAKKK
jgi:peptidyl-prolyl cis-trans isomerase SurA